MKLHNLLLVRHTGAVDDRLHDGHVAVERSNISERDEHPTFSFVIEAAR